MDTAIKLHESQSDIFNFGEVISQTENPANKDFVNACDLFSQHIGYQLKTITSNLCMKDIRSEMHQTTAQLYQLNELISPNANNTLNNPWPERLLDFCTQLQSLKSAAA